MPPFELHQTPDGLVLTHQATHQTLTLSLSELYQLAEFCLQALETFEQETPHARQASQDPQTHQAQ